MVFVGQPQHSYDFSNFSLMLYAYSMLKILESTVKAMT